jgi:hypothetical protein
MPVCVPEPLVSIVLAILLTGLFRPAAAADAAASRFPARAAAEAPADPIKTFSDLLLRLEKQNATLAEQNARLAEQNARLAEQNEALARKLGEQKTPASAPVPAQAGTAGNNSPSVQPGPGKGSSVPSAEPARVPHPAPEVGPSQQTSGQLVIVRSKDDAEMPFELRADLFSQVRYTFFADRATQWIDSAGNVAPESNFDSLELTRNFIQLSGYAMDRRLQFTANLFSSTAINSTNYLGWINYRFGRGFDLRAGNWIVPGAREWNESFRYTMGADRLMATTFFRPNISPGIWAQGEPLDNVHYIVMVANSLNRFNQGSERIGTAGAFGGTVWWEPFGPFGPGPSDAEYHSRWSPRIGTNVAVGHESNQGLGASETGNPEDTILRLSDGTPLFRPGALGPGVELRSANVSLWTIDLAMKYRGFALSSEYFLRWLDNFKTAGGELDVDSLFDHGALLQSGYFVLPGILEGFARTSFVTGRFGGGYEVGGGLNWYIRGNRDWRMTFEVLNINRSPAQNLLTGYRAGESGTLYQLQLFTDFF